MEQEDVCNTKDNWSLWNNSEKSGKEIGGIGNLRMN